MCYANIATTLVSWSGDFINIPCSYEYDLVTWQTHDENITTVF